MQCPHIITTKVFDILRFLLDLWMLQHQTIVCRCFVFVPIVLAIINVDMIQLEKAHQIPRDLCFSFGDIVDTRCSQQKITLFPGLLAIILQPKDSFNFWYSYRTSTKTFLQQDFFVSICHLSCFLFPQKIILWVFEKCVFFYTLHKYKLVLAISCPVKKIFNQVFMVFKDSLHL